MLAFGIGAAAPLIALGLASRQAMARWRGAFSPAASGPRRPLGLLMIALGLMIVTGADRTLETALLDRSPQWLTDLTTRF